MTKKAKITNNVSIVLSMFTYRTGFMELKSSYSSDSRETYEKLKITLIKAVKRNQKLQRTTRST